MLFFASVEQLDNPELKGKPVAVGGSGERHVVAAASYEARKFGVHSAMPSVTAKRLCPEADIASGIILKDMKKCHQRFSTSFMNTPTLSNLFQSMKLFLDVTTDKKNIGSATIIARHIKKEIREKTGLTASAGISVNKFLAKIASDIKKPDGLFLIAS